MKRLLAVLVAAPLAGCVLPPVQTYEGQPKPRTEIGIVKSPRGDLYLGQFSSYARRVSGEKLEFQKVGNAFTGYPTELHMVPGRFLILVRCSGGGGYGFPSMDFDVLPGMTYEISCESAAPANQKCSGAANNPAAIDFNAVPGTPDEIPCEPAVASNKRDGSFREAPLFSPPSGGGGGGYVYVPSGGGRHGGGGGGGGRSSGASSSRTSSFMSGFMNGLSSGLANTSAPQDSGPIGSVRAYVSKRYPSDQAPKPAQQTAEK